MSGRSRWAVLILLTIGTAVAAQRASVAAPGEAPAQPSNRRSAPDHPLAFRIVDLRSGEPLDTEGGPLLLRPVQPGSTIKIATLIAALESGVIKAGTGVPCPGSIVVGRERLACVHPRLRRPLKPAEALAYSCNVFFATVGRQLSRDRLNSTLASLGLPPSPASAPMPLAATGAQATSVTPGVLLQAWQRILSNSSPVRMRPETRAILLEGLRGAAMYGTASSFSARGIDALAKTGTALASAGGSQGIVLAAWPASSPRMTAVAVVIGGTGSDAAAAIAARAAGLGRKGTRGAGAVSATDSPAAARSTPIRLKPDPASAQAATTSASHTASDRHEPESARRPAAAVSASEPIIRVGIATASGTSIREMPLEDYVARVLAGEAAPKSTPAALEALAITARTFALANRNRHRREGFDLCTLTHCQVLRDPYAAAVAAAQATRGEILTWHGAPANVYYTASCGGRTERPSAVWPGADDPPYLPVQKDDGCEGEPRWMSEIDAQDLTRALRGVGYRGGTIRNLRVRERAKSGRVATLEIRGMAPDTITGQTLRMAVGRTLGWQLLKSTEFDVHRSGRGYRFTGKGFGHGVGFCVIGSARRAERGASRDALLRQYFPGTIVSSLASLASTPPAQAAAAPDTIDLASGDASAIVERAPGSAAAGSMARRADTVTEPARVTSTQQPATIASDGGGSPAGERRGIATSASSSIALSLPDGNAADRSTLSSLADRLLRRAIDVTGQPVPSRIQLVFHPSSDSFRRQTSQPWWSAAATSGARIDLQPVDVLRARGVLESTLAHEIGHVVTGSAVSDRAAWVQEGAAMYAGGLLTIDGPRESRRASCPSDDELRHPVSAGAARAAYARAGQCFERALRSGGRWDRVR